MIGWVSITRAANNSPNGSRTARTAAFCEPFPIASGDYSSASHSSGRPITFGETRTGRYIAVVFDIIDEDPLSVYPVTAYETAE